MFVPLCDGDTPERGVRRGTPRTYPRPGRVTPYWVRLSLCHRCAATRPRHAGCAVLSASSASMDGGGRGGTGTSWGPSEARSFYKAGGSGPNSLSWSIPNGGDTIDETTGDLTGSWSNGSAAIVTGGGGGGSLVGSSGAVISWRTSSIIDGHRPHGRTYVVPMLAVAFDTDGTITSSCQTTLLNGALSFVTAAAGAFEVWHRPKRDPNPPHAIIRPGGRAPVTGALVPDLAAVMRSRRQ